MTVDLVAILRTKIDTLPEGDHTVGLRAVLLHIERAFRHLTQGQSQDDEQAFTDAIYRTNQAFEGSIKEAYRVLASKSPEKKSPFEIESYLAQHGVFRSRVLAQFTAYRTQWRNPSAHDYTLSFDGSEAFLAIASVSAFACVLIDQIAERLAFIHANQDAEKQKYRPQPDDDEPARLVDMLLFYLILFNRVSMPLPIQTDEQLLGSVHGFLSGIPPLFNVTADATIAESREERVDLLVSHGNEKVFIELKRSNTRGAVRQGRLTLEHSMAVTGIKHTILYLYHPEGTLSHYICRFMDGEVHLLVPVAKDEVKAATEERPFDEAEVPVTSKVARDEQITAVVKGASESATPGTSSGG